jgi:glutamate-1-semialdehyde 2,1-aminomutase
VQVPGFYETLSAKTQQLTQGLTAVANKCGVSFCAESVGGMFGLYFCKEPPKSFAEVMACDRAAFNRFFHAMLQEGVYFAPSAYEAGFVSAMHNSEEIDNTLLAAERIFSSWV